MYESTEGHREGDMMVLGQSLEGLGACGSSLIDRGSGHSFLNRGLPCSVFPWAHACSHLPRRQWSRGIWTRVWVWSSKERSGM